MRRSACLSVVLKKSEEARGIYRQIVECCTLPSILTTEQTSAYRLCCTYEYPSNEPVVGIMSVPTSQHNSVHHGSSRYWNP